MFKTSIAKTSLPKSSIAYFQTFQKRYYEEVLPRNLYFKKTLGTILKKFKKKKKKLFSADSIEKREKTFFNKLNTSFVSGNKLFWKIVKSFFSNKGSHQGNLKLVEGNKLLQDDSKVAEGLKFFEETVSNLDFNENSLMISFPLNQYQN